MHRATRSLSLVLTIAALIPTPMAAAAGADTSKPVALGISKVSLTGPWKFHVGDAPRWAEIAFDDSGWESVDLTPPPGAHDGDVGLTGYVPGWGSRGHPGYAGYAWYRLHLALSTPPNAKIALAGPPAVDSAYQIFFNGRLLGQIGRFSKTPPAVVSIQPRVFALPFLSPAAEVQNCVIAVRVWMGAWDLDDPSAGGIHIAPAIGLADEIHALNKTQWIQTVKGYLLEVVEAAVFVGLAWMAWALRTFEESRTAYAWLCAALIFTAMYRANQALFFWGQFETVQPFEVVSLVLLTPLSLVAWTFAALLRVRPPRMQRIASILMTLGFLYVTAQALTVLRIAGPMASAVAAIRICFVGFFLLAIYLAIRQRQWASSALMLLIATAQFARELSKLGVPGIWFPFGTGVSRAQYAYAVFDVLLFGCMFERFLRLAQHRHDHAPAPSALIEQIR